MASHGLRPSRLGVLAAGNCGQHDRVRESRAVAQACRQYMRRVRAVLGADWPYGAVYCALQATAVRRGLVTLEAPCRLLSCPFNLVGEIGRLGLPVLYHRRLPSPAETCLLTAPDALTLAEVGRRLGVTRARVCQIERVILARARWRRSAGELARGRLDAR